MVGASGAMTGPAGSAGGDHRWTWMAAMAASGNANTSASAAGSASAGGAGASVGGANGQPPAGPAAMAAAGPTMGPIVHSTRTRSTASSSGSSSTHSHLLAVSQSAMHASSGKHNMSNPLITDQFALVPRILVPYLTKAHLNLDL